MLKSGFNTYGIKIGVLGLEVYFPKLPGHIKNAETFGFPVSYKIIKGATPHRVVEKGDRSLLEPFIKAAREFESEGIEAITSSCGFLALFQRELAGAVNIPVFTSSLLQVPMVRRMIGDIKKVGVLTANKVSLTQEHFNAVGINISEVNVVGMENKDEFARVILKNETTELNVDKLRDEVLSAAQELIRGTDKIGAIVLECTDLPPFKNDIKKITELPIFDIVTLTKMVYESLSFVSGLYNGNLERDI